MSIGYGLDCEEGEVDLGWGDCNDWNSNHTDGCMSSGCYSIEETTSIYFYESTGNLLQGEISPNIGELVNLTLVRLDDINQLTGVIPSEIGNLTNLQYLTLENNQLTGVIPLEIGNLTNLEYLKLTNNQVSGDIPSEIWNLTNLRYLYLGGNQLTGEIPSEIENLTSLVDLKLGNNQLTGEIPIELWSMNQNSLDFFDLSNNQLTGEIPDEIENSIFIFSFYLNDNQLSGIIPENTCQIIFLEPYSEQFKFENNNFCPPYPECLSEQDIGYQDTINCEQLSIIDETLPVTYNLQNAYPNPFNPVTTLRYDLPEIAMVNITIYDVMGRVVNNLVSSQQTAGYKSVQWNATNIQGQPVSAGVYLYSIEAGDFRQTKKMILLK